MLDQVPLDVEVLVLVELLNRDHEHADMLASLTVLKQDMGVLLRLALVALVHLDLLEQFELPDQEVTGQVLLQIFLRALLATIHSNGENVKTALEDVEQLPETHGLFLKFLLYLVVYGLVVLGG